MTFEEWEKAFVTREYTGEQYIPKEAWNAAIDEAVKVAEEGCDLNIAREIIQLKD